MGQRRWSRAGQRAGWCVVGPPSGDGSKRKKKNTEMRRKIKLSTLDRNRTLVRTY
jgi:hypothetical protein